MAWGAADREASSVPLTLIWTWNQNWQSFWVLKKLYYTLTVFRLLHLLFRHIQRRVTLFLLMRRHHLLFNKVSKPRNRKSDISRWFTVFVYKKLLRVQHNDMSSLESLLLNQEKEELKNPKAAKVTRKFIIAEAIYTNTGEMCPVDQLVKFKVSWK